MEKTIKFQKEGDKESKFLSKKIRSNSINPKKTVKILIVEDNMIVRFTLSEMLKNLGYSADFAEDGKAALIQYRSDYSIILMDIDISFINGFEVTQIIRSIEKNHHFKNVPIVAMTSHVNESGYEEKCISVGMNGLLGKPNAEELRSLILKFTKKYTAH